MWTNLEMYKYESHFMLFPCFIPTIFSIIICENCLGLVMLNVKPNWFYGDLIMDDIGLMS